jgi:hypothetical protein
MRIGLGVVFVISIVGCKNGGDNSAGSTAGAAPESSGAAESGGACKPLPNLCQRIPLADVQKLFETPAAATSDQNSSDNPMNRLDQCRYKQQDDAVSLDVTFIVECYHSGNSKPMYDGIKGALAGSAPMEELSGLGEEGYWYFTATPAVPFVQGQVNVRSGGAIFKVLYGTYRFAKGGITPEIAKQRAIEAEKRLMALEQ